MSVTKKRNIWSFQAALKSFRAVVLLFMPSPHWMLHHSERAVVALLASAAWPCFSANGNRQAGCCYKIYMSKSFTFHWIILSWRGCRCSAVEDCWPPPAPLVRRHRNPALSAVPRVSPWSLSLPRTKTQPHSVGPDWRCHRTSLRLTPASPLTLTQLCFHLAIDNGVAWCSRSCCYKAPPPIIWKDPPTTIPRPRVGLMPWLELVSNFPSNLSNQIQNTSHNLWDSRTELTQELNRSRFFLSTIK